VAVVDEDVEVHDSNVADGIGIWETSVSKLSGTWKLFAQLMKEKGESYRLLGSWFFLALALTTGSHDLISSSDAADDENDDSCSSSSKSSVACADDEAFLVACCRLPRVVE
jgi:hypothetical protein